MLASDLVAFIETFAPLQKQESWDNCGFSVGDSSREVSRVLLALDCTEQVLDEAVEVGADLIITHHPLIFSGVKQITPDTNVGRIITRAIRHNIAVYAAHTNMDKVAEGVSGLMADKLGLSSRMFLTEDELGMIGDLPQAMTFGALADRVQKCFPLDRLRTSAPLEGPVTRVAVCGGSGRSFIKNARRMGAQVYITGDITYHDFHCEKGFAVMDIGHYGSEYDIVGLFAKILCKNFPTFAVSISRKNNNPIYYY